MLTKQLATNLYSAGERLLWVVLLSLFVAVGAAQELASASKVIVIVPAADMPTWDPAVEEVAAQLKAARQSLGADADTLPILRLSGLNERQAQVLRSLEVRETADLQVLVCLKGEGGWPSKVLRKAATGSNPLSFVKDILRPQSEPLVSDGGETEPVELEGRAPEELSSTNTTQIGLLLVFDGAQEREPMQTFLSELGRHWMERYGRIDPPPYPLGYYNTNDASMLSRLRETFPELVVESKPTVALCFFSDGRPVSVLEVHRSLDLPATLVRRLSSARGKHLAESLSLSSPSPAILPEAGLLSLDTSQESAVILSRVHELAQQLWSGSAEDDSPENRLAKRNLLAIVELTRFDSEKPRELSQPLKAALSDFCLEPLILSKDSSLGPIQKRFLELANDLIE